MAWLAEVPGMGAAEDRVKKALSFPLGVASPLWIAFGAAASAGVAYWWMTRWTKAANLEAAFALAKAPITETVEVVEIIAEVVEAETEAVLEALTPEPELELEAEPEPEAVVEVGVAEPEVVAAPEPEPEPEPDPILAAPDDLTRLVGIGPKLAEALAASGVTRFAQIAAWTAEDLAAVDTALSLKGRAVRDAWVAQAARLAATH